jgi:RecB family exonuclease
MPLRLIRSGPNDALWKACAGAFLDELGASPGPAGFESFLLLSHRVQRDALLEMAAERGLAGWLNPPIAFFSDLRRLFGIEARPVGILTGRMLVARLAGHSAKQVGLPASGPDRGPAGTHMLDRVFSELLPEGVGPNRLREVLGRLEGDDFTRRRNHWVADTYEAFLRELESRDLYDPRSIHAMVADQIELRGLREVLGGADRLHVYGITSLRARRRLFQAIAEQDDVEAIVYLPLEDEPSEWDEFATGGAEVVASPVHPGAGEAMPGTPDEPDIARRGGEDGSANPADPADPWVQPAPDALREAGWVARRVKRLLVDGAAEPHEVAVVARSGHQDTRTIYAALELAGVPATARLRSVLAEIPALKALLQLLRAEADGWTYERLRQVLSSPYLTPGIDLRSIDVLAAARRYEGLAAWWEGLRLLREALEDEDDWRLRRKGVSARRLDRDLPRLESFLHSIEPLAASRPETGWVDLTLEILGGRLLELRHRLCRPVGERWDIVRVDQRGVEHVRALLREWRELVRSDLPLTAGDWHERLRRLLETNELAHSTPTKKGVQVLEAHQAALSPFRHTFIVHANDRVFPRTPTSLGVFSDDERRRLRDLGLPLASRAEVMRRERALWRSVASGRAVTISYRTTDSGGVPRLPSLMVPAHDPTRELPRTLDAAFSPDSDADSAATSSSGPASPEQHRRAEILRLGRVRRSGDAGPFRTPYPPLARRAVVGAYADELRSGGLDDFAPGDLELSSEPAGSDGAAGVAPADPTAVFGTDRPMSLRPTAWNGDLRDPVVLAELERRYHPEYVWSASQLEKYGKRPFDFLLERVLVLEEVAEAEEETSALTFGNAAHGILEAFYRELMDDLPATFDERAAAVLERVAADVVRRLEMDRRQWLGLAPLWAVTREDVREQVRTYLEWELPYLASRGECPVAVELQFGSESVAPVVIEGRDVRDRPAQLLLRGRIDRVDRRGTDPGSVLHVLDYKSGFGSLPQARGYEDGALLQTALYMQAVQRLDMGSVSSARYRGIRSPGSPANKYELKISRSDPTLRLALSIPGRIRDGRFEAVQARSAPIADWQPGRDVTRTAARLEGGTRFDPLSG